MNNRQGQLVLLIFVGMAAACRAEPAAVPPETSPPAKSTLPESAPGPKLLIEPTPDGARSDIPLPGPTPAVVDPRMGAWRQQCIPQSQPAQGRRGSSVMGSAAGNPNLLRALFHRRILEVLP